MKNLTKLILSAWAVAGLQAYGANLVQNAGFETGDFSDWTIGSPFSFTQGSSVNSSDPHSGSLAATLRALPGSGTLSQAIPVTAGDVYDVSFWLATPGFDGNTLTASFGGALLLSVTDTGTAYNEYEFTDVAAGTGVISFTIGPQSGHYELDDVSVTDVTPAGVPDSGPGLLLMTATLFGVCRIAHKLRQQVVA